MQNPHEQQDTTNMILAVGLSLFILLGYQLLFPAPAPVEDAVEMGAPAAAPVATHPDGEGLPASQPVANNAQDAAQKTRAEAIDLETARIPIQGIKLSGSINLLGGRLDDVSFNDHYITVAREKRQPLLSPLHDEGEYYIESGWVAASNTVKTPTSETVWQLKNESPKVLESGSSITLQWNNGSGLTFEKEFALDNKYLFTLTQRVVNTSAQDVTLTPYTLAARKGIPLDYSGLMMLQEGPLSYLSGDLEERSYMKAAKGEVLEKNGVTGWLGMADKYWLVALLPESDTVFNSRLMGRGAAPKKGQPWPQFQIDVVQDALIVAAGQTAQSRLYTYTGAKDLSIVQGYEKAYSFRNLELAIDFGILYLITKPFYWLFHVLIDLVGHVGAALLLLTVVVRGLMFPLVMKSYISMAKMKKIAPELQELKERHKDDQARMQQEIAELFARENVNPLGGCLPIFLQIPVFFALYKVILISIDLRHAGFWGWVHDLSAPDPTSLFNLFGLLPYTPPDVLMVGAWPCLFCLSMVLQMRLYPMATDPVQEKVQAFFPFFFTFMLAHFASGLVIYYTWSNVLTFAQQYYVQKRIAGEDVSLLRGHHSRRKKKNKSNTAKT